MNYQSPTTTKDRHMRYLILAALAALAFPATAGYSSSGPAADSFCSQPWCDPWWVDLPEEIKEKFNN